MRLVHLSDLHLGYRQYQRLTPTGVNQREADVAATFRVAVDRVIELKPELVVVSGDVFHNVRPTNQAILHAFLQFSAVGGARFPSRRSFSSRAITTRRGRARRVESCSSLRRSVCDVVDREARSICRSPTRPVRARACRTFPAW